MSNVSPWDDLGRPPLRAPALRRALVDGVGPWTSLEVLPRTGSTNQDLARRAGEGTARAGAVLATDHQVAGRGRLDRSWTAPPRSSVEVSVLVLPGAVPAARWSWLPLLAGLGVVDALVVTAGVGAALKWPNDVLVPLAADGEGWGKVCGVLAQVVATPHGPGVVVGLGLNVNQRRDELPAGTAASLASVGAATTDRDTVLRSVLRAVGTRYLAWQRGGGEPGAGGLGAAYREACRTIGQQVVVQLPSGEALPGAAEGVDDAGRLLVAPADGSPVRALAAGDVVHVRENAGSAAGRPGHGII